VTSFCIPPPAVSYGVTIDVVTQGLLCGRITHTMRVLITNFRKGTQRNAILKRENLTWTSKLRTLEELALRQQ